MSLKGRKLTNEHKNRIGDAHRGKRGHPAWNKNISPSKETREKISNKLTGRHIFPTKNQIDYWLSLRGKPTAMKGMLFTEERLKKMSETHKRIGTVPPSWSGKKRGKRTTEHQAKITESLKGNKYHFKGDEVGYFGLHSWIRKKLGKPSFCSNGHIAGMYHWANKSGEYKRDLDDWHGLCPSCNKIDGISAKKVFDKTGKRIIRI